VLSRQRGTVRRFRLAVRRWRRRGAASEAGMRWSVRYRGAQSCRHRYTITPSLYSFLSWTFSHGACRVVLSSIHDHIYKCCIQLKVGTLRCVRCVHFTCAQVYNTIVVTSNYWLILDYCNSLSAFLELSSAMPDLLHICWRKPLKYASRVRYFIDKWQNDTLFRQSKTTICHRYTTMMSGHITPDKLTLAFNDLSGY